MLKTIITDNFKELLDTLKTKPIVVITMGLMILAGLFIHKWSISKDTNYTDLKVKDAEIIELSKEMYKWQYEATYYKSLYEQTVIRNDSIFEKTDAVLRPIVEFNKK